MLAQKAQLVLLQQADVEPGRGHQELPAPPQAPQSASAIPQEILGAGGAPPGRKGLDSSFEALGSGCLSAG